MKLFVLSCAVGLSFLLTAVFPAEAGKSSVDYGKTLFHDAALGGSPNDKSCSSCHAEGAGLEKAAGKKKLARAVNRCLTGPMAGHRIDGRSVEMRSLKMYIESLTE